MFIELSLQANYGYEIVIGPLEAGFTFLEIEISNANFCILETFSFIFIESKIGICEAGISLNNGQKNLFQVKLIA